MQLQTRAGIENLQLTGQAATTGVGNALGNVVTGNAADNVIYGLDGRDVLTGGAGSDTISGGAGATVFSAHGSRLLPVDTPFRT